MALFLNYLSRDLKNLTLQYMNPGVYIVIGVVLALCNCRPDSDYKETQLIESIEFKQWVTGLSFTGKWAPLSSYSQFFKLSNNSMISTEQSKTEAFLTSQQMKDGGTIQVFFDSTNSLLYADKIYLQLTSHSKRKIIAMQIPLTNVTAIATQMKNLSIWRRKDVLSVASLYLAPNHEIAKIDISITIQIYTSQAQYKKQFPSFTSLPVKMLFLSPSIQFWASVTHLDYPMYIPVALWLLTAGLTLIICVFSVKINPAQGENKVRRSILFKTSQWFILQGFLFLFLFNVIILLTSMKKMDTNLGYCLFPAIFNIVLGIFYLRNYEPIIQRFKNKAKLLAALMFITVYIVLIYKLFLVGRFWVFEGAALMLMQILHSIKNGFKGGLPPSLLFFTAVSRVPLIYMMSAGSTIISMQQSASMVVPMIAAMMFGWFITFLQSKLSSRFMIPNQMIPDYHDYFVKVDIKSELIKEECPICSNKLDEDPKEKPKEQTGEAAQTLPKMIPSKGMTLPKDEVHEQSINAITVKSTEHNKMELPALSSSQVGDEVEAVMITFMKTPCKHSFHCQCLQDWMKVKLTCPICRGDLPPYEEGE